jgi:hypothetical protein
VLSVRVFAVQLVIAEKPHRWFAREDANLIYEAEVS